MYVTWLKSFPWHFLSENMTQTWVLEFFKFRSCEFFRDFVDVWAPQRCLKVIPTSFAWRPCDEATNFSSFVVARSIVGPKCATGAGIFTSNLWQM